MGELTRPDVALAAGVDTDYIDRLVELGLLTPESGDTFTEGDVRRARWLQGWEASGVPLDGMAAAVRDGSLSLAYLDAAAFERFTGHSDTTFRQLSERTGVPLELVLVIREASGLAQPSPDDQLRENELAIVAAIELLVSNGIRPIVIERWLRTMGDSLRRVAESETGWWWSEVERPMLEGGLTEREMLDSQAELGSRVAPLFEQALVALYRGQQERAWRSSSVEAVEATLERAGLFSRMPRPPAICFLDITGYTRLTEERGDEAAADLAATLSTLVGRSSLEHGGQPVKWLGDGVMFHFPDPGQGVVAALDMMEGVADRDLPPAHVGLHAGPVVVQEGDYFGRTVNVAARIAEYAGPGEVIVSKEVVDAANGTPVTFTRIGPVELKGLSGPIRLYEARSRSASTS